MKTPKDYLAEMQMDDDILFNRHQVSICLSDFIKEIQVDSYNQAIEDVLKFKKFSSRIANKINYVVDEEDILKLKIK